MKRIAPRTYIDPKGRYWARFPVNGRYTWKLLREAKTKREAIAAAQTATAQRADGFAALVRLYLDADCPTRKQKFKRASAAFVAAETRQANKLAEYFRDMPVSEVNDLLKLPQYARWRMRKFSDGRGGRAVDKELQTLSNLMSFAVFVTKQERFNYVQTNRPRYQVVRTHARDRMPDDAATIHQLADYFFDRLPSEVFGWQTLFQMFTGCRTAELIRLRLDAEANEPGHIANGFLHLGRRSKSGVNPYVSIGPEFAQMLECFQLWHEDRHPKAKPYFCNAEGETVHPTSHLHAMTRASRALGLPNLTPHGLRAYYVTKRRRDGVNDALVAAEIGDKTVALISTTYGDIPGGKPLTWTPATGLPSWLRWQPAAQKIARII